LFLYLLLSNIPVKKTVPAQINPKKKLPITLIFMISDKRKKTIVKFISPKGTERLNILAAMPLPPLL
jgi:hypothetical protein